ncbi:MAG: hypothetical protein QG584_1449 [Pseudomonadota bacterium]|nr:hypothetical protein [Pseudomonadota bacterium]
MAIEFSLQTALIGTLGSSAVLSATLCYLWRLNPSQRALLFWSFAFAAQTLRMAAQLGVTTGLTEFWIVTDILFAVVTLFIWLGTCALTNRPRHLRLVGSLLCLTLAWGFVAAAQNLPFVARTLPLYAMACVVLLIAAAALFQQAKRYPGIGYRGLGLLFALLAIHYLDYPFLRSIAWLAPFGFSLAAALMFAMGLAMLIITQRHQQRDLNEIANLLQSEIGERKETEYRYQTLVEELEEGIVVVDRNGQVVTANPAAARMLAVPLDILRSDTLRSRPYQLYREDGSPLAEADYPLHRTLNQGIPCPAETYRLERTDGSSVWLSINAHPLCHENGESPYAAIISFSDISERKAAERNLLASELRFRSIFEAVPNIAVQGYDRHRRVLYWNDASERFYGYTKSEALGQTIDSLVVHPEDVEAYCRDFDTCIAAGYPPEPGEYRARRKDGSIITIYSTQVMINNLAGDIEVYCIDIDLSDLRRLQGELQESSERFRAITESSELGVVVTDESANFIYCNSRYLTLIDASIEEVHSGEWIKHLHPDDREPMQQRWQNAVLTRTGFTMERRVITADGRTIWAQAHVVPIHTTQGEFRGFVATVEDKTALKEAEQALRMSEARFAGAFHASLDYISISRVDTGEIIDVNEAFERITGWRRDEVIGHTTNELGIWIDPTLRQAAIDKLKRDGYLREHPMQIGKRNGETVDCVLNGSIIQVGDTQLLLGVVRDVTVQKQAEEALRQSEEKFSRIVHYSPTALAITDAETSVVVDFNSSWQELFGFSREAVIGRTSVEFGQWVDLADREALYQALRAGNGEIDRYECRYQRFDGTPIFALASARMFDIDGRKCYLWSVTDITLRHELEERMTQLNSELETRVETRTNDLRRAQDELIRAEKLAALGSLVAGVAHELNTPIGNSVTVASTLHEKTVEFADLISDGTLKRSSLNNYLTAAQTASDLLLRSLNQARNLVASFKQVAVDQTSDQRRHFDLREVVGEVLTTLSPTIRKTPFSVSIDIPEGIVMDSFPGPLGQIVTNFVTNALLHAFEGRLAGIITLHADSPEGGLLMLTVSDDGNGIPEEHLRRIFDPFFTTKLGKGGSGLGLNIVYNIVTGVLGGRISVRSSLGAGTTFVLTMPLCAPGDEKQNPITQDLDGQRPA